MPYKNIQDRIENSRIYHIKNKEKIQKYVKEWGKRNPDKVKASSRKKNKKYTSQGKNKERYIKNGHIIRQNQKIWRIKNPDKDKNSTLKKKYGITLEHYRNVLDLQENRCASCRIEFSGVVKPQVDHCHETGIFRGILCRNCNIIEGFLTKKAQIVKCVNEYKKKFNNQPGEVLI